MIKQDNAALRVDRGEQQPSNRFPNNNLNKHAGNTKKLIKTDKNMQETQTND